MSTTYILQDNYKCFFFLKKPEIPQEKLGKS